MRARVCVCQLLLYVYSAVELPGQQQLASLPSVLAAVYSPGIIHYVRTHMYSSPPRQILIFSAKQPPPRRRHLPFASRVRVTSRSRREGAPGGGGGGVGKKQ